MTTVAQLNAVGRGRVVHLLEIAGYPYCFATIDGWTPTDSWYTTRGYDGVYGWLLPQGLDFEDHSRFLEGELEVSSIEVQILDYDRRLTAMLKDFSARNSSRLNADLADDGTTVTVLDADVFPAAPDRAWLGLEAVEYTGKTGTTLTGCTRGALGTTARAYEVDVSKEPPIGVMVTDGPTDIRGRPARIHMAVLGDDGTIGATTVLYRGFVGTGITVGKGLWRVPIEHCSVVFGRNVAQGLPSSAVKRGYWYAGTSFPGLSTIQYSVVMADETRQVDFTIDAGRYASQIELAYELWRKSSASSILAEPYPSWARGESGRYVLTAPAYAAYQLRVTVREGDPVWALGFDAGVYEQDLNTVLSVEAANEPRLLVVDWSDQTLGVTSPAVAVDDSDVFTAGLHAALPGLPYAEILTATGDVVTFKRWTQDVIREQKYWSIDDEEDLTLRHVFALGAKAASPDTVLTVAQKLVHLYSGQLEPESWCAIGLAADDVDWDELEDALAGAPLELLAWSDAIAKATPAKDLLAARLGLLGIASRITTEGRIGWARIDTPVALAASSIEVDEDVWSLLDAAEVEASLGGESLVTQALLRIGYDYRTDEWGPDIEINWADGAAERGRVRAITYELRGLVVHPMRPAFARSRGELRTILAQWMTALHYSIFGRLNTAIEIPCVWMARQLRAGDVVRVTHPLLPDVCEGSIGMVDRLGVVEGRKWPTTSDQADVLTVRIPPSSGAGGIAPAALGTSWVTAKKTLTFADCADPLFAAHGGNDLDDFSVGMDVLLWEWNTGTQPVGYPLSATITSIGSTSVKFSTDPFGGGAMPANGVLMTFPDWDDQDATQQTYLAIADTSYTLGSGGDEGFVWGV